MRTNFTEIIEKKRSKFSIEIDAVLYSEASPFQKIEVFQTSSFGRVLAIDGFLMLTESDEFIYHEMIAHVPLFVHPQAKRILVVGGGDGGTVRECLRHPQIEQVDLVEIDEMVTRACIEYFPSVAGNLASERVRCRFEDGVAFVKSARERYDIIIIDSTDPISVGEGLFSSEFYHDCFNLLHEDGILVNQSESPAWQPELVQRIHSKLSAVFPAVHFYQAHIPTYPSGHWAFGFATKKYHPLNDFNENAFDACGLTFKYYNKDLHRGSFALPNFFQALLTPSS